MNNKEIYNKIIENAKLRGLNKKSLDYYTERHHIIPRCLGGLDIDENFVLLTAREHFICHHLLWRSNRQNMKLFWSFKALAFWKRSTSKSPEQMMTSKQYEELRKIHSENLKKRMRGRIVSEETKEKLSIINKGKILSEKTKKKISTANKGIDHSEEWNKKVSKSLMGRKHSSEHVEKNRIAHLGKKYSAETNAKKGSKGASNPSAVKCSINGLKFDTLDDAIKYATRELKLTIHQANAKFTDPTELNFIKHKNIIAPNAKRVSIDNIIFDSITKAYFYVKNKYNIGNSKMIKRIESDEYTDWKYV